MKTEIGNKLIAEFMGARMEEKNDRFHFYGWTDDWNYRNDSIGCFVSTPTTMWGTKEQTLKKEYDNLLNEEFGRWGRFHKDWNWLMPVWNKIMSIGKERYGIYWTQELTQDGLKITIAHREDELLIVDLFFKGESIPIENVWGAIVKFIEWHNKNKQNNKK